MFVCLPMPDLCLIVAVVVALEPTLILLYFADHLQWLRFVQQDISDQFETTNHLTEGTYWWELQTKQNQFLNRKLGK